MNIKDQTVQIKGAGHPDMVAHYLSFVALQEIEAFNEDIYVNVDSSTIKAGRTPELSLGGYMCFDFNKYEIDYRYKLEKRVSESIYSVFKDLFPYGKVDVKFNFALYPDNRKKLVEQDLHDCTGSVTAFYPCSELEMEAMAISDFIHNLDYAGLDYKIILSDDKLVVSQCFFQENKDFVERLEKDIKVSYGYDKDIIINPDQEYTGVLYHNFGSKVFDTSSGNAVKYNGTEGFYSPERPRNDIYISGKNSRSSARLMYKTAYQKAKSKSEESGNPVNVTASWIIGSPREKYNLKIH